MSIASTSMVTTLQTPPQPGDRATVQRNGDDENRQRLREETERRPPPPEPGKGILVDRSA